MTTPAGGQDKTTTYITSLGAVLSVAAIAAPIDWIKWPLAALAITLILIGWPGLIKAASPKHWKPWLALSLVPAILTIGGVAIAHNAQAKAHAIPYCSQLAPDSSSSVSVLAHGHGGASLHLDKVVATEQASLGGQGCVGLDVTLRNDNPGRHVAVVNQVDIHILKTWPLSPICIGGKGGAGLTIRKNYTTVINLADNQNGGTMSVDDVTEQLGPNDADRFAIMAKLTSLDAPGDAYLVEAQITVYANGVNEVLTSDPFLFSAGVDAGAGPLGYLSMSPNDPATGQEALANRTSIVAAGHTAGLRTGTVDQLVRAASTAGPLPVCPL